MTMKKLFYDVLLKGTKLRNSNYESYRVKYFDYALDKVNEILKKSSKVHHFTIKTSYMVTWGNARHLIFTDSIS